MKVTFIAHAGISIEEDGVQILIDPWFTGSNTETPLLEGLLGHKTIDFQIPPGGAKVEQYASASGVFLSHFHTHHAPKKDLTDLLAAKNQQTIFIGHPKIKPESQEKLAALLKPINQHAVLRGFADSDTFSIGPFTVRARTHTVPNHLAWHISSATGSVLHIADPFPNRDRDRVSLDQLWDSFAEYKPDLLFINAGGNVMRGYLGNIPSLQENACVTPAQAALLVQKIQPKVVSLIGCYNKSLWNGTNEYMRPSSVIEDEFYWSIRWVAPQTRCVFARPGHRYGIKESQPADSDTFIA